MRIQQEIFQELVSSVVNAIPEEWIEFIIAYKVDDTQSGQINTYLTKQEGVFIEKSILAYIPEIDKCLRELRDQLSSGGKEPFSRCKVHLKSDGEFSADYSFDPIDWEVKGDWNFDTPHKEKLK